LQEYGSLDGIYENIDSIKGATQTKLIEGKESAYMSYEIATIYKDVPLEVNFEDLKYLGIQDSLKDTYQELEFHSLLSKLDVTKKVDFKFQEVEDFSKLKLDNKISLYIELDKDNYHYAKVLGCAIADKKNTYYSSGIKGLKEAIDDREILTYDYKKHLSVIDFASNFDLMIAGYLLNLSVKDDITSLMVIDGINVLDSNAIRKQKDDISTCISQKARFIYDVEDKYLKDLTTKELDKLFYDIEMPLVRVLSNMEKTGMICQKATLDAMKNETKIEIDRLTSEICSLAGKEFNVSSPMQLGKVLFEDLGLPFGKTNKHGYKTDAAVLEKLVDKHPIIEKILDYRNLSKIYSTYLEGLEAYIDSNSLIHPIFKQTLARTGRLSCTEPNLQNIPTRDEYGKRVRKAFIPQNDEFISFDYSQIELRLLAHISQDQNMIRAFVNDEDIHTHVAADIYGIPDSEVSKMQRKTAKAVIFGIVYGISGFGLGENLHITPKDAKHFIEKYYELYPDVKKYMDNIIKEAKEKGYVKTLYGRIRVLDELNSSVFMVRQSGERMALNTPIQGTSADIIKLAMVRIFNKMNELQLKSKLVLQIHDELIFDVTNDELDIIQKMVKEEMENVIKLDVPLKVGISIANNWYGV
jgi:DNA polymerase-1